MSQVCKLPFSSAALVITGMVTARDGICPFLIILWVEGQLGNFP